MRNTYAWRLGANIRNWIKTGGGVKKETAQQLLGCTRPELMCHLESTFTAGMSWDRLDEIEIDHIRPKCSFDMCKLEDRKACWHFTNLRCLWAKDNRAKLASDVKLSIRRKSLKAA